MKLVRIAGVLAAAVAVAVGAVGVGITPAPAASTTDTFFVHGYGYGNCHARGYGYRKGGRTYTGVVKYLRAKGFRHTYTIGYYAGKGDGSCDRHFSRSANRGTSINTLGAQLATYLARYETGKGRTVNLIGHSMGGVIIRAAIAGVARHAKGYPSRIRVANAVTIDSPHQGVAQTRYWTHCNNLQCRQLSPHYAAYRASVGTLPHAPQGSGGTDWSLLGSTYDRTVGWRSGVDAGKHAQHKYHWLAGQPSGLGGWLSHGAIKYAVRGNRGYRLSYWKTGWSSARHTSKGWSPLYAVYQSVRYPHGW